MCVLVIPLGHGERQSIKNEGERERERRERDGE